ncbi:aminoglycoside phosphotransferase family protein, partial [Streptomyces sp. 8K308]|uniref:phosphotransferase family protein n=1 Tax=Streptomyces sp. 8K308 TaxID=2530388 RepID=UPI00104407B1
RRAALLRAVAALDLGVRTPTPIAELADPPRLSLTRVPGEPLPPGALDSPAVFAAAAEQLATLLARLATAPSSALPRQAATHWRDFADAVVAELHPLMSREGRARADAELAALRALPALDTAVVHGDLGGENLLWEWHAGLPVLTGVIDWDEVALGDQAEDLAALSASYGPELLAALSPSPAVAARVATIRGSFALQQALVAQRDGDDAELADGLANYR